MKRNHLFIIGCALLHSWFFYEHYYGLNVLLFAIVLVLLLAWRNTNLLRSPQWLAAAAGSLISGAAVFAYGTDQAVFMNRISLIGLGAFSIEPESSLLIALFNGAYSVLGAVLHLPLDAVMRLRQPSEEVSTIRMKKLILAIGPLAVTFVFFLIYYFSNDLFRHQIDQIDWSFINIGRLFSVFVAAVLLYGFFCQQLIRAITEADQQNSDSLNPALFDNKLNPFQQQLVSIPNQIYTGVLLFTLLNLLLFAVNGTDVYYLFITRKLPAGVPLHDFLHNGTNALILSILMAIGVILFFFKGKLNFEQNNTWLRRTAYLWILQNVVLVATTCVRNTWYISEYGLTYRRIGVFIYLLLCVAGLITTALKVAKARSNWFLFRKNAWIVYSVLTVCVVIDWDRIITGFNISHFEKDHSMEIDANYLIDLGDGNLDQLYQFYVIENRSLRVEMPIIRSDEPVYTDKTLPRAKVIRKYEAARMALAENGWQDFILTRYNALKTIQNIKK